MARYTVSVTGEGAALAPRFERLLDVLGDAALVGSEETPTVTLIFDVSARDDDHAIECAFYRVYPTVQDAEVTLTIVPASRVVGRRPWWRRLLLGA